MRTIAILALLALGACGPAHRSPIGGVRELPDARTDPGAAASLIPESVPLPDSVRTVLVAMGVSDQAVREGLTPERIQDTAVIGRMDRTDARNTTRLKGILLRYGWPTAATAGREAADAAFLVLQHSPDHVFQKTMAPRLEALGARGVVPSDKVALLVDRVLMHEGSPQRYGTQFSLKDGKFYLYPVEDEAGLEARRAAMGLPPMAEYMKMMAELYQAEVVRDPPPAPSPR